MDGTLKTDEIFYSGKFVNNQFEGNGKIKYLKKGEEYDGGFENGLKNGKGIYKYANRNIFEGEWV